MNDFLNIVFFAFHTLLIGFNLIGWAFPRTRVAHRVTVGLTLASWFILGAFYGWGYCLCTDWHFQIRRQLGYHDPETSYIQLLARKLLGISLTRPQSNLLAMGTLGLIVVATAFVWIRDRRRSKSAVARPVESV